MMVEMQRRAFMVPLRVDEGEGGKLTISSSSSPVVTPIFVIPKKI
jgi:hypothetical protein